MILYALEDKYNEDCFYCFEKEDTLFDLKSTSLMPTKELAEQFIEENLGNDFRVVEVTFHRIMKDGTWEFSVKRLDSSDDEEGECLNV